MTPAQLHHICHLNGTFNQLAFEKFRADTKTREVDLIDLTVRQLLEHARDDSLSMFINLQTAIEKLEDSDE